MIALTRDFRTIPRGVSTGWPAVLLPFGQGAQTRYVGADSASYRRHHSRVLVRRCLHPHLCSIETRFGSRSCRCAPPNRSTLERVTISRRAFGQAPSSELHSVLQRRGLPLSQGFCSPFWVANEQALPRGCPLFDSDVHISTERLNLSPIGYDHDLGAPGDYLDGVTIDLVVTVLQYPSCNIVIFLIWAL